MSDRPAKSTERARDARVAAPPLAGGRFLRERMPIWLGPLAALIALVAGVTAYDLIVSGEPVFLRPSNILNVLQNWSFVGLLAIGMTFVIIAGGIDLSVGSLVAFAGGLGIWVMNTVIAAAKITQGVAAEEAGLVPPYSGVRAGLAHLFQALGIGGGEVAGVLIGFAAILLAGLAAGLLNGVLIAKGRIAPFIATLGGLAAYRSLALSMADGGEFRSASPTVFQSVGTGGIPIVFLKNPYGRPLILPWPVVVLIVVGVLAWILLNRTRYGRYVFAIGGNEQAAVYSAIRVDRIKIATYTLLGGLTGLAALLNSSRMNSVGSGNTASMWELDAIAAVVIGGTRMGGGAGSIVGTVIGLLVLGVIGNMLNLLQISPYLQGLVKGVIIVAAVLVQRGRRGQ